MGDDYVRYGFPFIDVDAGGGVAGVIKACEAVLATLPADVKVVPGHGQISNLEELREYVRMLKDTSAVVAKALEAGKSLEQMQKHQLLGPWSKQYSRDFISTDTFLETLYNSLSQSGHTPFVRHNCGTGGARQGNSDLPACSAPTLTAAGYKVPSFRGAARGCGDSPEGACI
jgi:cyclase